VSWVEGGPKALPRYHYLRQSLGGWSSTDNRELAGVRDVTRCASVGMGVRLSWFGNEPRTCWGETFSSGSEKNFSVNGLG